MRVAVTASKLYDIRLYNADGVSMMTLGCDGGGSVEIFGKHADIRALAQRMLDALPHDIPSVTPAGNKG